MTEVITKKLDGIILGSAISVAKKRFVFQSGLFSRKKLFFILKKYDIYVFSMQDVILHENLFYLNISKCWTFFWLCGTYNSKTVLIR